MELARSRTRFVRSRFHEAFFGGSASLAPSGRPTFNGWSLRLTETLKELFWLGPTVPLAFALFSSPVACTGKGSVNPQYGDEL